MFVAYVDIWYAPQSRPANWNLSCGQCSARCKRQKAIPAAMASSQVQLTSVNHPTSSSWHTATHWRWVPVIVETWAYAVVNPDIIINACRTLEGRGWIDARVAGCSAGWWAREVCGSGAGLASANEHDTLRIGKALNPAPAVVPRGINGLCLTESVSARVIGCNQCNIHRVQPRPHVSGRDLSKAGVTGGASADGSI